MVFRTIEEQVGIETDTGSSRTFTADEAILKGQLVKIGSSRGVEPSDTDGEAAYGVAAYDAAAGEQVLVYGPGCVVLGTSGTGAIAANERVASHGATGEEGEFATYAAGDEVLGVALEDDVGTNDDVVIEITLGGVGA